MLWICLEMAPGGSRAPVLAPGWERQTVNPKSGVTRTLWTVPAGPQHERIAARQMFELAGELPTGPRDVWEVSVLKGCGDPRYRVGFRVDRLHIKR